MNVNQSHRQQQTKRSLSPLEPTGPAEAQADALLERAQEAQAEQTALLEATPLEAQYCAAFTAQVESKHDQAERIENRIENLIDLQTSRMQQIQSTQPGFFALPGASVKWQQQMQQQQSTMQRLKRRLEAVRDIKDGMGIHGPRIEELATRKLRAQAPELANEWADMQEAQRRHEYLKRRQEQDQRHALEREGRGIPLGLSQTR